MVVGGPLPPGGHVVRLQVGGHGDAHPDLPEEGVRLVHLGHPGPPAGAGVAGEEGELPPQEDPGVQARLQEDGREHPRGGGLAVGAGHARGGPLREEVGEELHPAEDPKAPLPGLHHLGVVRGHGGGDHQGVLVGEVAGVVPVVHGNSEPPCPRAWGEVAPRHRHPFRHEEPGEGAHAHAFNAHDVRLSHRNASRRSARRAAAPSGERRAMALRRASRSSRASRIWEERRSHAPKTAPPAWA